MSRLEEIREAERASHEEIYSTAKLFQPGSWLAKPVTTVMAMLPLFEGKVDLRVLDLGCGVGRNSIPIAEKLCCSVDCVDILPMAIDKLNENALHHGVEQHIYGRVCSIDDYAVEKNRYDLILAVSALEHVRSRLCFAEKLLAIRDGIKTGGIVCLVVNSEVRETNQETGEMLLPQFEVNLSSDEMLALLFQSFLGWQVIKQTVVHQCYLVPRGGHMVELNTDVVTFAAKKV